MLVESTQDPASQNIARALRSLETWKPARFQISGEPLEELANRPSVQLLRTSLLHLEAEPLEAAIRTANLHPDALIFLSKHKAASGRPSLTVHPVGNYGEARFGGQPGRLSPASPALQSTLLEALNRQVQSSEYPANVTFEVTHHGPLLKIPTCFLELGSSETEWDDPEGGRIVAQALLEVIRNPLPTRPIAVGLGGGHYAPRFTDLVLSGRVHIGHVIPGHVATSVSDPLSTLQNALDQTPGVESVCIHAGAMSSTALESWKAAVHNAGMLERSSSTGEPVSSSLP